MRIHLLVARVPHNDPLVRPGQRETTSIALAKFQPGPNAKMHILMANPKTLSSRALFPIELDRANAKTRQFSGALLCRKFPSSIPGQTPRCIRLLSSPPGQTRKRVQQVGLIVQKAAFHLKYVLVLPGQTPAEPVVENASTQEATKCQFRILPISNQDRTQYSDLALVFYHLHEKYHI